MNYMNLAHYENPVCINFDIHIWHQHSGTYHSLIPILSTNVIGPLPFFKHAFYTIYTS